MKTIHIDMGRDFLSPKLVSLKRGLIVLTLFFGAFADNVALAENALADRFSKFGILRANIAEYCSDSKWLVCFDIKPEHERSEVVGFDKEGNIFVLTGHVSSGAGNLLSLESYEKPSVMFSTKEGYLYIWNTLDGGDPFEFFLSIKQYEKLIQKFELYPLLKSSKDGPVSFELLKENSEFYDRALAQSRPESIFELKSPTTRRSRIGMSLSAPDSRGAYSVKRVRDHTAAAAAGLKPNDHITKLAVNGENFDLEKIAFIGDDKTRRIITLRIQRKSDENEISLLNINIFPPSYLELFLGR